MYSPCKLGDGKFGGDDNVPAAAAAEEEEEEEIGVSLIDDEENDEGKEPFDRCILDRFTAGLLLPFLVAEAEDVDIR